MTDNAPEIKEIEVRFEIEGEVKEISKMNRVGRRLIEGQVKKIRKRFKDAIGPDGERPTVVIKAPKLFSAKELVFSIDYPESMKGMIKDHDKAVRISDE